jgi:DNA polymerase-3 subunit epsilon
VHGIRTEDLLHAPPLLQLWPEINSRLRQRVVVAHGAGTEKRFLRAFPMHGFGPWVDSLAIAQAVWPDLEDYSLSALSTQLGLTASAQAAAPGLTFHDALFDSVLSLLVLRRAIADASLHQAPLDALCRPDRSRYYARRKLRG